MIPVENGFFGRNTVKLNEAIRGIKRGIYRILQTPEGDKLYLNYGDDCSEPTAKVKHRAVFNIEDFPVIEDAFPGYPMFPNIGYDPRSNKSRRIT